MESKVIFADLKLKEAFLELERADPRLYKEINKAIEDIKQNAYCGRNVKKALIPKELIIKYNLNNLWIYNLRVDWRLIYTISNTEIEVLSIVLDWMNHKDYERLFNF
ncbi:MAG: hypothetical protein WCX73_00075 [Candidatus Pacearchaeota archaeon]|jgi:Txe/YoeB family toxin of Txe-Axe toxin-antitoxin module